MLFNKKKIFGVFMMYQNSLILNKELAFLSCIKLQISKQQSKTFFVMFMFFLYYKETKSSITQYNGIIKQAKLVCKGKLYPNKI